MESEVAGLSGAERHERTGERTAYRNGSRSIRSSPLGSPAVAIRNGGGRTTLRSDVVTAQARLGVGPEPAVEWMPITGIDTIRRTGWCLRLSTRALDHGGTEIATVFG